MDSTQYALFKSLEKEINGLRDRSRRGGPSGRFFVPVAYAGGISPPDDPTDADAMMAWLDSRKIIDMEWQKIRDMMEKGRGLEISAKRGDDDDGIL